MVGGCVCCMEMLLLFWLLTKSSSLSLWQLGDNPLLLSEKRTRRPQKRPKTSNDGLESMNRKRKKKKKQQQMGLWKKTTKQNRHRLEEWDYHPYPGSGFNGIILHIIIIINNNKKKLNLMEMMTTMQSRAAHQTTTMATNRSGRKKRRRKRRRRIALTAAKEEEEEEVSDHHRPCVSVDIN